MNISVVIVNWNTGGLLRGCVASVFQQVAKLDSGSVEVIVVDNASSDGSVGLLRQAFGDRVILVENAANEGFARACNIGSERSTGDYVLFLNPDTEMLDGSVEGLAGFLDGHPETGLVGPRLVGPDGETQASCAPFPTLGREFWRLLHLDRLRRWSSYPVSSWPTDRARRVDTVQGACIMVRRTLLDEIGPFDEGFFVYSEEIDFCRRAADSGWGIEWVPQARVLHLGGQSTRLVARKMFLELYRNKLRYFRKHYGLSGALVYKLILAATALPRLVLPSLLIPLSPGRRNALREIVFNYGALLRHLPTL